MKTKTTVMAYTSWRVFCKLVNIGEILKTVALSCPWVISVDFQGWVKEYYIQAKKDVHWVCYKYGDLSPDGTK